MLVQVLVAVAIATLSCSSVWAQTAGEMLLACEQVERAMHKVGDKVLMAGTPDANKCWGFIAAVTQYSTLADQTGKTLLNSCPPIDGINITQVVRIFTNYARKHPEKFEIIAAAVAYNATADAFPCK